MPFSIQTNVNSLIAQENLRVNSNFQSQTIQRLTSGYRINQSGDDAAGLAIANKFRSDTAELTQGVRNANDGISTLQIIDGGMNNIGKMLDRLKTLATQSSSETFTGDRAVLNKEYQTLVSEIDRQAQGIGLSTRRAFRTEYGRVCGRGHHGRGNADTAQRHDHARSVELGGGYEGPGLEDVPVHGPRRRGYESGRGGEHQRRKHRECQWGHGDLQNLRSELLEHGDFGESKHLGYHPVGVRQVECRHTGCRQCGKQGLRQSAECPHHGERCHRQ